MQKVKISKIFLLISFAILLMLSIVAEAMLWDNGYGEMKGGLVLDRMTTTFKNARSVIFILGFLIAFILVILSFFKKFRKKCLIILGVLAILLFILAVAGQIVDDITRRDVANTQSVLGSAIPDYKETEIPVRDIEYQRPKIKKSFGLSYTLCKMASYSNSYGNQELMKQVENEFIDELDGKTKDDLSDIRCEHGETLLSRCTYKGWDRAVDLLLEKGVDVNVQGYKGNTALHWAYLKSNQLINCYGSDCQEQQAKYQRIIDSLLKYGASKTILNQEFKTPEQTKMKY